MTLHVAKGLEFPAVFLVGMEDGIFPHSRSIDDPKGIEEERRLFYVGITRARQFLYLSHAWSRTVFGSTSAAIASRFLNEIPEELVRDVGVSYLRRPDPARVGSDRRRNTGRNPRSNLAYQLYDTDDPYGSGDKDGYEDRNELSEREDFYERGDQHQIAPREHRAASRGSSGSSRTGSSTRSSGSTKSSGSSGGSKKPRRLPKMAEERFSKGR
jgi:hypothetical protein